MYKRANNLPEGAILLEIWSENRALMARLDAAPWLLRVEQREFDDLIVAGWSGRGRQANLVRFFQSCNDEVAIVVRYAGEMGTEICFRLDSNAAVAWVRHHRPQLRTDGHSAGEAAGSDPPRTVRPGGGATTMELLRLNSLRDGSRG